MKGTAAQPPVVAVDVRDSVEYLAGLGTKDLTRLYAKYRGLSAVRELLPAERERMRRIEQVLLTRNGGVR